LEELASGSAHGIHVAALAAVAPIRPPKSQIDHDQRRVLAESHSAGPPKFDVSLPQRGQMCVEWPAQFIGQTQVIRAKGKGFASAVILPWIVHTL
jgi:hypothetical protein